MTGKLSKTIFKKSPELNGKPGALSGQRVVAQDYAVPVRVKITAAADMQHHLAATGWIVVNHRRLGEAVGPQVKILAKTGVTLVKVDVKHLRIKHVQLMAGIVVVCLFNPHHVKPVKYSLRKEKTGQHGVFLQFCVLVHAAKVINLSQKTIPYVQGLRQSVVRAVHGRIKLRR